MSHFFRLLLLLFLIVPGVAVSQIEEEEEPEIKIADALDKMLKTHPNRFLVFWVDPQLTLNSGYDSNGLYSLVPDTGDYFFSVAPSGSFGLRFGTRAFFIFDETVNFLYYNELEQLRDIYNETEARFITGSRKTLFTLTGGYVNKKERIDDEFDVPAQQKRTYGGTEFEVALSDKLDMMLNFRLSQYLYEQDPEIISLFPPPPDHNNTNYGASFEYRIHPRFNLSMIGQYSIYDLIDDDSQRNSYRVLGGVRVFAPGINGLVSFGYGKTVLQPEPVSLSDLIADARVTFLFSNRRTATVFARRNHDISRLGRGNIRVTTEGGVRGSIPLGTRLAADGHYRIGKNDYGRGVEAFYDHFQAIGGGIAVKMMPNLSVRGGPTYFRRDSNFRSIEKSRFVYEISINYKINPE